MESYRTDAGPRQLAFARLGQLDETRRLDVERAARDADEPSENERPAESERRQLSLFNQSQDAETLTEAEWGDVTSACVPVESKHHFDGSWLARWFSTVSKLSAVTFRRTFGVDACEKR